MGCDPAKLIEIGVIPWRDDSAVAHKSGRFDGDRSREELDDVAVLFDARIQLLQQRRVDGLEAGAQRGKQRQRGAKLC